MKLFNLKLQPLIYRFSLARGYTTDFFPYTNELYKKNYIKYPTQSKQAIIHDYNYSGDERLPTFEERLKEFKDPVEEVSVNIGKTAQHAKLKEILSKLDKEWNKNKNSRSIELKAMELKIDVPFEKVESLNKILTNFDEIVQIANHYKIYKHLFEQGHFKPVLDLKIEYTSDNNVAKNVYHGNRIPANLTKNKPKVTIEDILELNAHKDKYHSLVFLNLDGNFSDSNKEVLLWFKTNVKNGDFSTGDELIEYLQPFPMRGSGWHRCAYVLFEHEKPFDYKLDSKSGSKFQSRVFKTSQFYLNNQDVITPVGLAFFQTEWDLSVKNVFHNNLEMEEPVYEFDFGPRFLPEFEKYPKDQPFNWYLQEYMDKKDLNEQVMKEYLKELNPFDSYPESTKYPLIDMKRVRPRWFKYEEQNIRTRKHQYQDIPFKYSKNLKKINEHIASLPYQAQNQNAN